LQFLQIGHSGQVSQNPGKRCIKMTQPTKRPLLLGNSDTLEQVNFIDVAILTTIKLVEFFQFPGEIYMHRLEPRAQILSQKGNLRLFDFHLQLLPTMLDQIMHHVTLCKGSYCLPSFSKNIYRHLYIVEFTPIVRILQFIRKVPQEKGVVEATDRATKLSKSTQDHTHPEKAYRTFKRILSLLTGQVRRADVECFPISLVRCLLHRSLPFHTHNIHRDFSIGKSFPEINRVCSQDTNVFCAIA